MKTVGILIVASPLPLGATKIPLSIVGRPFSDLSRNFLPRNFFSLVEKHNNACCILISMIFKECCTISKILHSSVIQLAPTHTTITALSTAKGCIMTFLYCWSMVTNHAFQLIFHHSTLKVKAGIGGYMNFSMFLLYGATLLGPD